MLLSYLILIFLDIASISNGGGNDGLATALGSGTTVITAASGAISNAANLTVTAPELISIAITPPDIAPHVPLVCDIPPQNPVAIFGIRGDSIPLLSDTESRTLSAQQNPLLK